MLRRAGEDGLDKVRLDRLGIAHVIGEEGRFDGDVVDVVECCASGLALRNRVFGVIVVRNGRGEGRQVCLA